MKKVAVVWSSPNKEGLTASAKEQITRGVRDAGAEIRHELSGKENGFYPEGQLGASHPR